MARVWKCFDLPDDFIIITLILDMIYMHLLRTYGAVSLLHLSYVCLLLFYITRILRITPSYILDG